jgi:hypothetical protein
MADDAWSCMLNRRQDGFLRELSRPREGLMMLPVTSPQKILKILMGSMQPCADRSASGHIPVSENESLLWMLKRFQRLSTTATPTMRPLLLKRLGLTATLIWTQ